MQKADIKSKNVTNIVGTSSAPSHQQINCKCVGATSGCSNSKGISLVALIITIIVMLILVGVTVSVALNGGLFSQAKSSSKQAQIEADKETLQSAIWTAYNGQEETLNKTELENSLLVLGWKWTVQGEEYICTSSKENKFVVNLKGEIEFAESKYVEAIEGLAEGVELVPYEQLTGNIKLAAEIGRIKAALKETVDGEETIAVVPTGFEVSTADGENSISEGLVIKDGANEFVWIPYSGEYTEDNLGPITRTDTKSGYVYDSQEQLDYYYGEGYFNYNEDFNYEQDKTNIEASINKYKGFYVGRYETTIDENGTIGSMRNKTVLTANKSILETNNKPCIWYGLYKVQKDMYSNSQAVFSTMITSKEWDAIMAFTGYGDEARAAETYTSKPDLSGSAYKGTTDTYDISKNMYDLAGNLYEFTLKIYGSNRRAFRGSSYFFGTSASQIEGNYSNVIDNIR